VGGRYCVDQQLYSLISEAKKGGKDAFALLLNRYKAAVFRHAYGMLGDRMEAEDVTQETFIKAYYSLSKLENEFAFTPWLTRIVSRLCYDRLHKRKKESAIDEKILEQTTEGSLEQQQLRITIEEAMNKLSPEHLEAIVLREVQGYSYDEIAGMLEIPLGTVKSRINAARLLLRNEMKQ
jgi:RNA polymerase sigma factor (sigma-70 family)